VERRKRQEPPVAWGKMDTAKQGLVLGGSACDTKSDSRVNSHKRGNCKRTGKKKIIVIEKKKKKQPGLRFFE